MLLPFCLTHWHNTISEGEKKIICETRSYTICTYCNKRDIRCDIQMIDSTVSSSRRNIQIPPYRRYPLEDNQKVASKSNSQRFISPGHLPTAKLKVFQLQTKSVIIRRNVALVFYYSSSEPTQIRFGSQRPCSVRTE